MTREEKGCVKILGLNSDWIVMLFIGNTGFHEQFWCWKMMGSALIAGLRHYGESRRTCQGWSLKFRWTEDLGDVMYR